MSTTKNSPSQPIGFFDSGIGGLTVASAVQKLLPHESILYFGDTAHLPYGEKSADAIKYYAIRIAHFLMQHNCKMIVIACNTASALAYEVVKDIVGDKIPVINVIDPIVDFVESKKDMQHIGIIATKGTIKSDIYAKKIIATNSGKTVSSLATPLLASMIEEGFFNNKISRSIIHSYLSRPKLKKIDSIILACTHYPLIKPEIEEFYKGEVQIVDTVGIVSQSIKNTLSKRKLLNKTGEPKNEFYVSDYTKSFEESSKYFFDKKIKLKEANIWK